MALRQFGTFDDVQNIVVRIVRKLLWNMGKGCFRKQLSFPTSINSTFKCFRLFIPMKIQWKVSNLKIDIVTTKRCRTLKFAWFRVAVQNKSGGMYVYNCTKRGRNFFHVLIKLNFPSWWRQRELFYGDGDFHDGISCDNDSDGRTYSYIYGLVQERRNSIANAPELCLSCSNPSICS